MVGGLETHGGGRMKRMTNLLSILVFVAVVFLGWRAVKYLFGMPFMVFYDPEWHEFFFRIGFPLPFIGLAVFMILFMILGIMGPCLWLVSMVLAASWVHKRFFL